jgi:hypothetical protein
MKEIHIMLALLILLAERRAYRRLVKEGVYEGVLSHGSAARSSAPRRQFAFLRPAVSFEETGRK